MDALQSAALSALRMPLVQLRLLLTTPEAMWPAGVGIVALTAAWWAGRTPSRRADVAIHAAVMLIGMLAIGWFLRWGEIDWTQTTDWRKEWAYYSALQQGVVTNTLPYLMPGAFQGTERYIANLETLVAPHALLLRVTSITQFFLWHVLLAFAAGFVALVGLRRELQLSVFGWLAFLALFVLNGHVTGHLAVGHTQWAGYFLLPWVYLCVLRLARGDASAGNATTLAVALSAMVLVGAWHVFVWSAIFVAVGCLAAWPRPLFLLGAMGLTAALAALRLAPALLTFGTGSNAYLGDFGAPSALLAGLTGEPGSVQGPLDWVEYNTFVGWTGLAAMGIGLVQVRSPLWLPSMTLVTLSMGGLYGLTLFHLPGFISERVSSRLAIVGVLGLILIGLARADRWLAARPARWAPGFVLALLLAWLSTVQLVLRAEQTRPRVQDGTPLRIIGALKDAPVDPQYWWAVWAGATISAAAGLAIIGWAWWPRRRPHLRPADAQRSVGREEGD